MENANINNGKSDNYDYKKLAIDFIKNYMPGFYVTCKCGEQNSSVAEKCIRCNGDLKAEKNNGR
jgi:hypothetical protein